MIIMVSLDQNKPIWLISKIQNSKFKNPKFVNCTFIIRKNGIKTTHSKIKNSTSFMFNNYFCEMNLKKVTHGGLPS